jgi:hypothetical protein
LFDTALTSKTRKLPDQTRAGDRRPQKPTDYRYTTIYLTRGVTKLISNPVVNSTARYEKF